MKTTTSKTNSVRAAGVLVIVALVASVVNPALGQTTRHKPRLRKYARTSVRKVQPAPAPAAIYHSVNSGQLIRVRLNQTITSETARVGDQFSTTVVTPIYANGVEVIPAGSTIIGQVRTVERAGRKSKPG